MKKGHWLYSVSRFKCPQCHEGDYYPVKNPYNLFGLTKTYDNCPNCNLKYEIEPGFYLGAMYISYALGSGTAMIAYTLLGQISDFHIFSDLLIIFGVLVVTAPLYYKLSRIMYLNIFVHYRKPIDPKI
jgi:hypothetical protein